MVKLRYFTSKQHMYYEPLHILVKKCTAPGSNTNWFTCSNVHWAFDFLSQCPPVDIHSFRRILFIFIYSIRWSKYLVSIRIPKYCDIYSIWLVKLILFHSYVIVSLRAIKIVSQFLLINESKLAQYNYSYSTELLISMLDSKALSCYSRSHHLELHHKSILIINHSINLAFYFKI